MTATASRSPCLWIVGGLASLLLPVPALCADPAAGFRVEVPAPVAGEGTATLFVYRAGTAQPAPKQPTHLVVGGSQRDVGPGERAAVPIGAHATRLQRLVIDGRAVLVHLAPGAKVGLVDDACAGWRLQGDWLDPNQAKVPQAYCAAAEAGCQPGFTDGLKERLVPDPVCKKPPKGAFETKRCVRLGEVRFAGRGSESLRLREWNDDVTIGASYYGVQWLGCVPAVVRTDRDEVVLGIGPAERWTLSQDARGQIVGVADGGKKGGGPRRFEANQKHKRRR